MEKIKYNGRLTNEERETVIVFDNVDKKWHVDTTITKHMNRFKKKEWTQTAEYIYDDGLVFGGAFEGSETAITIRNPNKKRVMTEKQMNNLHGCDEDDEDDE